MPAPKQSEASFQKQVIQFATLHGWRVVHHPDSRRATAPGWPDLVLGHDNKSNPIVCAELKRKGKKPRESQEWWLTRLREAGLPVYVWTPDSWAEIERVLGA